MPLCRCSWLYQCTNRLAQSRAACRSVKPLVGNSGRYLAVRNSASANALSSLTRGRECDGAMPSQCSMASTVMPFRLAPLSPCSTGRAANLLAAVLDGLDTESRGEVGFAGAGSADEHDVV